MLGINFFFLILCALNINAEHLNSDCYSAEMVTKNATVTKTRVIWVPRFPKLLWPRKQKVETYEEIVPVYALKKIRFCCKGFVMNEVENICLPHCEIACAAEAECIQPNECKCRSAYKEIRDHRQPEAIRCELLASVANETAAESTESIESTTTNSQPTEPYELYSAMSAFDCKLSECPEKSECLHNGTCVCLRGYQLLTDVERNSTEVENDYYCVEIGTEEVSVVSLITVPALCVGGSLVILIALIAFVWLSRGRLNALDKKGQTNVLYTRDKDESINHC